MIEAPDRVDGGRSPKIASELCRGASGTIITLFYTEISLMATRFHCAD
jgi:hypothetical protein